MVLFGKVSQNALVLRWGLDHATRATWATAHVYLITLKTILLQQELLQTDVDRYRCAPLLEAMLALLLYSMLSNGVYGAQMYSQ